MDKTRSLARIIRDSIADGAYSPDGSLPSEREFQDRFDLSRTTVRRAIQTLVNEGRVVRRAGVGAFVAGAPPVAAIEGTPTMSLIIPTFSNPLYTEMIDGIEQEARRSGLRLLTSQSGYSVESESRQLLAMAADETIRGAIVVPSTVDGATAGALDFVRSGKPLVYLGRWPEGIAADGASANYHTAAKLAVGRLIALGHRDIAYVEGTPHLPGFSLMDGYQAALKAARLPQRRDLARILDLPSEEAGKAAIEAMLMEKTAFTAVFARNDVTAIGVVQALRTAGLRIPEDVSVASVNDSLLARSMSPPLSSVNIFPEELGRLSFRLLRERMEHIYQGPPVHVLLEPSLIVRGSTAAPGMKSR